MRGLVLRPTLTLVEPGMTERTLVFIYLSQFHIEQSSTIAPNNLQPTSTTMPPTRRKSAATSQQTLAFGPRSKVTKPSAPPASTAKKASRLSLHEPPVVKAIPEASSRASPKSEEVSELERPLTPINRLGETSLTPESPGGTLAIRHVRAERTELEKQALRIGDADLKEYWLRTEDERKAKAGALFRL